MGLQEQGQAILDTLARIRELRRESERLYCELADQGLLMLQGIDPKEVAGFYHDIKRSSWLKQKRCLASDGRFNVAVMKDGKHVPLQPIPEEKSDE